MAALTAVLLALLALPAGAVPSNIGVASAVRGVVHAAAPSAAGRVVETGRPVYALDHVTTGADGKLQILLLDETTFTLGPNSDMILDEFVYDPASGAGKVSASMAKGVFRFVTGKVARKDPGSMRVTMPVGTIGIRGTMVAGQVETDAATIVLIGPGRGNNADEAPGGITVGNDKGSTDVDTSGYGVSLQAGQAPSAAFEVPAALLQTILGGVSSSPSGASGESGGGGGGSADEGSGQDTAEGKTNSSDALATLGAGAPDTAQFAAQVTNSETTAPPRVFVDGTSDWSDVLSIQTGTALYSGSGPYSGSAGNGTFSFQLDADFGAKTLGGGASNIAATSPMLASSLINSFSYAALTGLAQVNLLPSLATPGNITAANLTLVNAGGIAAKTAVIDITLTSGPSSSGQASGSRP